MECILTNKQAEMFYKFVSELPKIFKENPDMFKSSILPKIDIKLNQEWDFMNGLIYLDKPERILNSSGASMLFGKEMKNEE